MAEARATTIRFSEPMYSRLEHAGEVTGLPINSIVVIACLEWLDAHQPLQSMGVMNLGTGMVPPGAIALPARGHRGWPRLPGIQWTASKYPFDRFAPRAKRVLLMAQQESEAGGRDYIGEEDLLMALFLDPESAAGRALRVLGLEESALRLAISTTQAERKGNPLERFGVTTSNVRRIIDAAFKDAKSRDQRLVGTHNLLLGLVSDPDTLAAAALEHAGVTVQQVAEATAAVELKEPDEI